MSKNQRLGLIALAVVIAAAAFAALRPTAEKGSDPARDSATPKQGSTPSPSESKRTQTAEAKPQPAEVRILDGRPASGRQTLRFTTGETARIDVTSSTPSEVHLHGYDIEEQVAPGRPARLRFEADIEGVFELEDHQSGQRLASVQVSPR